jgi:hypothetical protein
LKRHLKVFFFLINVQTSKQMEEPVGSRPFYLCPEAYQLIHMSAVTKINPGDHIARPMIKVSQWHHGIYAGHDGKDHLVIHMQGDDKPSATIFQDTMENFAQDATHIAIVKYRKDNEDHRATLERAHEALKNPPGELYDLLHNNCEHFATYCRTGRYVLDPFWLDNVLSLAYERVLLSLTKDKFAMWVAGGNRNGPHTIRAASEPRDETEDEEEDDYYWGPSDEQLQAEAEAEEEYQNYEWHKSRGDLMEPAESR